MKHLLPIIFSVFFLTMGLQAQVGIGTTTPDASSILDINATDKGVLIPQVSLSDVSDTMLDGLNTAATGLLIYNTNAGTVGGSGVGYYYFNGSIWERLVTSASADDHDFYEEGTTNSPDDINDDQFTMGNLAIGKNTADYKLDITDFENRPLNILQTGTFTTVSEIARIESTVSNSNTKKGLDIYMNTTGAGYQTGIYSELVPSGSAPQTVLDNRISGSSGGQLTGVFTQLSNTNDELQYGIFNFNNGNGTGEHYGVVNNMVATGSGNIFGTENRIFNNGSGAFYGTKNELSGDGSGTRYATHNFIDGASNATIFGNYTLLGNTGSGTHYGNWTRLEGTGTGIQLGNRVHITNSGNNTHYGEFIRLEGNGSGTHNGTEIQLSGSGGGAQLGTINVIDNSGNGLHYGSYNVLRGTGTGAHYGNWTRLEGAGTGAQYGNRLFITNSGNNNHYANFASLSGSGDGDHYVSYSVLDGNGTGDHYGDRIWLQGAGTGQQVGNYTDISNSGNGLHYGSLIYLRGSGSGPHYGVSSRLSGTGTGSKYGVYSQILNTAGGTHYGVYSDVLKAGSYAGYFRGNVSIGTTTGNNYILPASRGTANQLMQTDSAGNVSWVDDPSPSYWSRTGGVLNLATPTDDITFTSDQTSITFPNTTGTPPSMIYMFQGSGNADRMVLSHSPAFPAWGLEYEDTTDSFIFKSSSAEKVEIDLAGGFPLRVYGTARAQNFQSDTTTYPDYVFESYFQGYSDINSEYFFKTLAELESFIIENGHLPNVKSFEEIKEDGMTIDLGDMTVTNLEKIEEAYIYIIELKKQNDELQTKLDSQQREIDEIKALLKKQ